MARKKKSEPVAHDPARPFRLGLATCLWAGEHAERARLACMTLAANGAIDVPGVELVPVAVWSHEDPNIGPALTVPGWHYVERPNRPLSDKWNAAAEALRDRNVDAMMIFGSDDFLNAAFIGSAVDAVRSGADYVMPKSLYFYDAPTREAIYCHGVGRVGGGRTLSRRILRACLYEPWERGYMKNIDGCMDRRLVELGHKQPDVTLDDIRGAGALLLGVKTRQNMHAFAKMKAGLQGEVIDGAALLRAYVPQYAHELWGGDFE